MALYHYMRRCRAIISRRAIEGAKQSDIHAYTHACACINTARHCCGGSHFTYIHTHVRHCNTHILTYMWRDHTYSATSDSHCKVMTPTALYRCSHRSRPRASCRRSSVSAVSARLSCLSTAKRTPACPGCVAARGGESVLQC